MSASIAPVARKVRRLPPIVVLGVAGLATAPRFDVRHLAFSFALGFVSGCLFIAWRVW